MYNFDGRLETLQSTLNGGSESRAFDGRGGYCGEWGWGRGASCVHPQENKAPLKHCLGGKVGSSRWEVLGGKFSVGSSRWEGVALCNPLLLPIVLHRHSGVCGRTKCGRRSGDRLSRSVRVSVRSGRSVREGGHAAQGLKKSQ
jgi:hypothetical protein